MMGWELACLRQTPHPLLHLQNLGKTCYVHALAASTVVTAIVFDPPAWCGVARTLCARDVETPPLSGEAPCHTCFSKENQVHTYMYARIKFYTYSRHIVDINKTYKPIRVIQLNPGNRGAKLHK
jgi:hypothetical protein